MWRLLCTRIGLHMTRMRTGVMLAGPIGLLGKQRQRLTVMQFWRRWLRGQCTSAGLTGAGMQACT